MLRQTIEKGTFLALLIVVTLAFGLVISDFNGAIFWAAVFALIFMPLQRKFLKFFNYKRNLASLASLLFCLLLVIIPLTLILIGIIQECLNLVKMVKDPATGQVNIKPYIDNLVAAIPPDWLAWANDHLADINVQERIEQVLSASVSFAAPKLVNWGQNTFGFAIAFCVMLYLLYFFFRDGEELAKRIIECIPLSHEYKTHLFQKFATVVKATVKGNIVIAVIQGFLGGVAFYVLGIQGALLWGVLMSFLSLLPAVGASLIWIPVAAYLLITKQYIFGVGLILFGSLVIGMVDNVLRPILVGKDTKLPDYVVLVTTLGGMSLVGLNGFVIGPLIAALFVATWGLFDNERVGEETKEKHDCQTSAQSRTEAVTLSRSEANQAPAKQMPDGSSN